MGEVLKNQIDWVIGVLNLTLSMFFFTDVYDSRSAKASVVLPTAPKASRDFDDIIDKVPQDPPYIAYLTNLPYDVDENEISNFFKNMKVRKGFRNRGAKDSN